MNSYHGKMHQFLFGLKDMIHRSELLSPGKICVEKWSKHYLQHEKTMYCDSLGLDHTYDLSEKEEDEKKWLNAIPRSIKMHTALDNEKAERIYQQNIQRMVLKEKNLS
jgi:hypothetical protein